MTSGWDISGKLQSVTSAECKDTSLTNKFNPCCRDNSCAEGDVGANMQTTCVFCNLREKRRGHLLCKALLKMGHEEANYAVNNRTKHASPLRIVQS